MLLQSFSVGVECFGCLSNHVLTFDQSHGAVDALVFAFCVTQDDGSLFFEDFASVVGNLSTSGMGFEWLVQGGVVLLLVERMVLLPSELERDATPLLMSEETAEG